MPLKWFFKNVLNSVADRQEGRESLTGAVAEECVWKHRGRRHSPSCCDCHFVEVGNSGKEGGNPTPDRDCAGIQRCLLFWHEFYSDPFMKIFLSLTLSSVVLWLWKRKVILTRNGKIRAQCLMHIQLNCVISEWSESTSCPKTKLKQQRSKTVRRLQDHLGPHGTHTHAVFEMNKLRPETWNNLPKVMQLIY